MTDTVLFFVYSNKYICASRIAGARRYAERRNWNIHVIERGNRTLDVKGLIDFWKPIGIIAECGGGIPELSRKHIGSIPCVYFDEDPNGDKGRALYVNSDSSLVGEIAAKELLMLDLPHYAFVGWREKRFWSEERRKAFQSALRLNGKPCHVFDCPPETTPSRRKALLGKWLNGLPKPCGIFAAHDPVAEDVLELAAAGNIAVPEELAVIGVDDDPIICERTLPPLTSIGLDFEQGGFLCCQLLDERIKNPAFTDAKVKFGITSVTRRLSTRRFCRSDRRVSAAISFIRRTACEGVSVPMVASVMGLKRRMAEMVFRRETGHSIHDEIRDVRLERVEALLRNPLQQISTLADFCGWKSQAALRVAFHAKYGMSPSEWRQRTNEE